MSANHNQGNEDFKSQVFIINGAILLLFAVLISISNGLLLFMIYKDPLKKFRNATAVLVVSLGIADFLTGCVTALDVGITHILEGMAMQKDIIMLQAKIVSQITVRASLCIMIMFAVERFIAVAFPYVYRKSVTIPKTIVFCALCWMIAIVTSCLELLVERDLYDVVFLYLIFVLPLLTIISTYSAAYCALLHRHGRLYKKKKISRRSAEMQKQLMTTSCLIILVFFASLVPFWVFTTIRRYCKECVQQKWFIAGYRFSIPILYINSALNPLLYAWRMRPYRQSFQALFQKSRRVGDRRVKTNTSRRTSQDELPQNEGNETSVIVNEFCEETNL